MPADKLNAEKQRLEDDRLGRADWRKWGAYVSDRQWGTVREDYSADGNAWEYFPHDHARSRAYRWGEDGIAGVSDADQHICLALVLWNGNDPILKERFFGLTNREGNHGEDVKEIYYYLDATPTNSYLSMLYKYPQRAFPYSHIVTENRRRSRKEPEFELIDTGIFDDDRYFDVFVEYAKAGPEDLLMQITAFNRGPEPAELHLIPQIWFRNNWSWKPNVPKPVISRVNDTTLSVVRSPSVKYTLTADSNAELLFTDNETNVRRMYGDLETKGYFKDAFHEYFIHGWKDMVNPAGQGTKAGLHYHFIVPVGGSARVRLRLSKDGGATGGSKNLAPQPPSRSGKGESDCPSPLRGGAGEGFFDFDQVFSDRKNEADEFFDEFQCDVPDPDARNVQRQAIAGLIWSKQFYHYDVPEWLAGDPTQPAPPPERRKGRNSDWEHLNNHDVITMPDKWEYPWYAGWDLAFHMLPFAHFDPEFAKQQLILLTREWYMHPNGQLPAYEWNFGDSNPPVHAWAAWRVFQIDRRCRGDAGDLPFLERVFHKMLLNFTWWVNRKDAEGRNVFQGGFLGLDNIGVFDRNSKLPMGGYVDQADGTAWMAMYSLNLMRIALELALHNHVYEDIATKFFEHFLNIAAAMTNIGGDGNGVGLWDDEDGFFYDELVQPDGKMQRLKVRSIVGLIPLFAVETLEPGMLEKLPEFSQRLEYFLKYRPNLADLVSRWHEPGVGERRLLSLLRGHRMKLILKRMLDETEFLSDYGVRALSRYHRDHPYVFGCAGSLLTVEYQPAESDSGMFGGNSNWRGPIWFPVNYLIIESLQKFNHYYGPEFRVECPTGSGKMLTINEIAVELSRRLIRLFLRNERGRRAVFGQYEKFQNDPHFRDYIHFYEYFDGDTGRGVGASHQTGWTALVAKLLHPRRPESDKHRCPPGVVERQH